jgi:hypothetical protein
MKKAAAFLFVLMIGLSIGAGLSAWAAGKTYQVTGPVLEVRPDAVVVQKGTEKWEIAKVASTKVTGDLKVGAKVTIMYTMSATDITVTPAAKAKK